jgi:hypothetical protein
VITVVATPKGGFFKLKGGKLNLKGQFFYFQRAVFEFSMGGFFMPKGGFLYANGRLFFIGFLDRYTLQAFFKGICRMLNKCSKMFRRNSIIGFRYPSSQIIRSFERASFDLILNY